MEHKHNATAFSIVHLAADVLAGIKFLQVTFQVVNGFIMLC